MYLICVEHQETLGEVEAANPFYFWFRLVVAVGFTVTMGLNNHNVKTGIDDDRQTGIYFNPDINHMDILESLSDGWMDG